MGVRLGTHLDRADVVGTNDAIRHHNIVSSLQFSLLNLLYQIAEMVALDSMMRSVVPMFNNLADDKSGPKFDGISRLIRNWDFYLRRRRIAERERRNIYVRRRIREMHPRAVEEAEERVRAARLFIGVDGDER